MPRRNRNVSRRCPGCKRKIQLSTVGTLRPHTCSSGSNAPERKAARPPERRP